MRKTNWQNLYHQSQQLTKPTAIDHLLSETEIGTLETLVIQILNKFLDRGELHKGIKIYVDKKLRNDIVDLMQARRPQATESLADWCQQIFGAQKFGVVFNSLEAYDNRIGEVMVGIVQELIEVAGLPLGGLSFLFFMGNYGFTPFGIHKEAKGEEGFLFHLGPAQKKFYTWDSADYNQIEHNTQVFHDVAGMIDEAKCYTLSPASVMFIPHQVYHIANTETFSLSVVMDYINPAKETLVKELAQRIGEATVLPQPTADYLPPLKNNAAASVPTNYIDPVALHQQFNRALEQKILKLKSNLGILKPSIRETGKYLPNGNFITYGKSIFPIYEYQENAAVSYLIARGNLIQILPHQNIVTILAQWNKAQQLSLSDLQEYLQPNWELSNIYGLIDELHRLGAIEVE
ncbi:MAG: RNA methylase [Saprospiraceae bacterium]